MVYFNMYGRLGNLLFQYAAALSLGRGRAVGVTADEKTIAAVRGYGSPFAGLEIVPAAPASAKVLRQVKCDFVEFAPVSPDDDVLLDGYFQSERYFDVQLVRSRFEMPEGAGRRLRSDYADVLSRPGVTSIHVRRGDYLTLAHCHPFVGERYFRDCLARLPEANDFVVCSDDLPWCRDFFPATFPDRRFVFSHETDPVSDMYLCSLCENHVMSNSSLSWWGAWLDNRRGKRVLAPSLWFGFALNRRGRLDWSSIYPQGAEVVRNRYSPSLWLRAHMAKWRGR